MSFSVACRVRWTLRAALLLAALFLGATDALAQDSDWAPADWEGEEWWNSEYADEDDAFIDQIDEIQWNANVSVVLWVLAVVGSIGVWVARMTMLARAVAPSKPRAMTGPVQKRCAQCHGENLLSASKCFYCGSVHFAGMGPAPVAPSYASSSHGHPAPQTYAASPGATSQTTANVMAPSSSVGGPSPAGMTSASVMAPSLGAAAANLMQPGGVTSASIMAPSRGDSAPAGGSPQGSGASYGSAAGQPAASSPYSTAAAPYSPAPQPSYSPAPQSASYASPNVSPQPGYGPAAGYPAPQPQYAPSVMAPPRPRLTGEGYVCHNCGGLSPRMAKRCYHCREAF